MGANRVVIDRIVKDCGNSWCDQWVGCRGHTLHFNYNSVVDIATLEIDGEAAFIVGDTLRHEIKDILLEAERQLS